MYAMLLGKEGEGYDMFKSYRFADFLIDGGYAFEYQRLILEKNREAKLAYILNPESSQWKRALKYLKRARHIAKNESHCYSRQVAAIIVGQDGVDIRTGYNGPPIGFPHCEHRHPKKKKECPRRYLAKKEGREFRSGENLHLCPAAHAERNAIYFASRTGVCIRASAMYIDANLPCKDCAIAIAQSGISEIICLSFKEYLNAHDAIQSLDIFYYAGIKVYLFREQELLDNAKKDLN